MTMAKKKCIRGYNPPPEVVKRPAKPPPGPPLKKADAAKVIRKQWQERLGDDTTHYMGAEGVALCDALDKLDEFIRG